MNPTEAELAAELAENVAAATATIGNRCELYIRTRDLSAEVTADIAGAWAAAAAYAGALTPRHVAEVLTEHAQRGDWQEDSLSRCVREATRRALDEHAQRGNTGPTPRGLSVHIEDAADGAVLWISDNHEIRLWLVAGSWTLWIRGPADSPRIAAAAGYLAYHWDPALYAEDQCEISWIQEIVAAIPQ